MRRALLAAALAPLMAACAGAPVPLELAAPPGAAGPPALVGLDEQVIVTWPGRAGAVTVVPAQGRAWSAPSLSCDDVGGALGPWRCDRPAPVAAAPKLEGDGGWDLVGLWPPRWARDGRVILVARAAEGCVIASGRAAAGVVDHAWRVPGTCAGGRRVELDPRGALVAVGDVGVALDTAGALVAAWALPDAYRRLARLGGAFVALTPRPGGWRLAPAPPPSAGLAQVYRPGDDGPAWLRAGATLHFGLTRGGGDVAHVSVRVDAAGDQGLAYAWADAASAGRVALDRAGLEAGARLRGPLAGWPLVAPRSVLAALRGPGRAEVGGEVWRREGLTFQRLQLTTGSAAPRPRDVPVLRARRERDGARIWIVARGRWPVVVKAASEGGLFYLAAVTVDGASQGARKEAPE